MLELVYFVQTLGFPMRLVRRLLFLYLRTITVLFSYTQRQMLKVELPIFRPLQGKSKLEQFEAKQVEKHPNIYIEKRS